jgi:DNA polymerase I-like protein with 3'-5' exonuclease and polymerase domains
MGLTPISKEAVDLFLQSQITLSEIETNGIKIDIPYLQSAMKKVQSAIRKLENKMLQSKEYAVWRKIFGGKAKLTSRQQLGDILFGNITIEKRGIDGKRRTVNISKPGNLGYECTVFTEHGKPEISEKSLVSIDLPFVKDYIEYLSLQKVLGTSLKGIAEETDSNGFVHPSFNLNMVQT